MIALIVFLDKLKKALVVRARKNRVQALTTAAEGIDESDDLLTKRLDNITKMANDTAKNAVDKRDADVEVLNGIKLQLDAELTLLDNLG